MTGITPVVAALRPLLPLVGTLAAYEAGLRVQRHFGGAAWANPVMVAVALVASSVAALAASPTAYLAGVQSLTLLLGPATLALAVPLSRSLPQTRVALTPILATVVAGAVTAIGTAMAVAELLGAPVTAVQTVATKSVTAAVAIAVATQIGSDPSLAAGIAVLTGIVGAVMCTAVLDWCGVHDERARGLATGIRAHGIGTARMPPISRHIRSVRQLGDEPDRALGRHRAADLFRPLGKMIAEWSA
jgi:putative effector of murein hydrolase